MDQNQTSKHRVNGELVKVPRKWDQIHLDAGYDEQEFGEHSTPNHPLLGLHGDIHVEHADGEPVYGERADGATVLVSGAVTHGPEFKLTWPNGVSVHVLCADVVRSYLEGA